MSSAIAVAAATGRLGRATVHALLGTHPGSRVIALARDPTRLTGLPGVEARHADYAVPETIQHALRGVAALVLVSAPVDGRQDRVALHGNVIEAARRAGVRRVLYTSVIGNGAEMQTSFAAVQRENRETERRLASSGLEWIVARNGFYLDIDVARIREAAARGRPHESCAGEGRCNYVSIAELGRATAALIAAGERVCGRAYNLVGEAVPVPHLTRLVAACCGLQVTHRNVPDAVILASALADPGVARRGGEPIARMLLGLQQGQRLGAFDVPSDFAAATGRCCAPVEQMLRESCATITATAAPVALPPPQPSAAGAAAQVFEA